MPETIVLLHGFAGTGRMWEPVLAGLDPERYRPLAPDLRGHGTAADRRPVTFETVVADVLDAVPERFALAGYSMGGRIALQVALTAPERVTRLVLLAATAGIEDDAQRATRREADETLARRTERGSIDDFAREWMAQPLFAGTPPEAAARWEADIRRNDPAAIAAALRGLGTGVMAPLWGRLQELPMPVLTVAGERDVKYVALTERIADTVPDGSAAVIPGTGHGIAREAPESIVAALMAF